MTTTICSCCNVEIPPGAPVALDAIGEVCSECEPELNEARLQLNKQGMVGLYTGPCPDNEGTTP